MDRKKQSMIWWIAGIVVLGGIVGISIYKKNLPGKYDTFASCIKESGALFYVAFWCPHCQEQKALFGNSAKLLPYVECSLPSKAQNQTCNDAGIKSYPTWKFTDGSVGNGVMTFEQLAEKTQCKL